MAHVDMRHCQFHDELVQSDVNVTDREPKDRPSINERRAPSHFLDSFAGRAASVGAVHDKKRCKRPHGQGAKLGR